MSSNIASIIKNNYPKLFVKETIQNDFKLPPEKYDGHIEYKRTLVNCDHIKIEQYATQMKWRIFQRKKLRATYFIGVDDDGSIYGLDNDELFESFKCFIEIANRINASIIGVNVIQIDTKIIIKTGVMKKKMENEYIDFEDNNNY